jgi:hypothetical protein
MSFQKNKKLLNRRQQTSETIRRDGENEKGRSKNGKRREKNLRGI